MLGGDGADAKAANSQGRKTNKEMRRETRRGWGWGNNNAARKQWGDMEVLFEPLLRTFATLGTRAAVLAFGA